MLKIELSNAILAESAKRLGMDVHPIAFDAMPCMTEREFSRLVCSIERHGLHESIWTDRCKRVVDGRHRANADSQTEECELFIATQKDRKQRAALREAPAPRGRMPRARENCTGLIRCLA